MGMPTHFQACQHFFNSSLSECQHISMLANTFLTTPSANANTFLSLPTLFSQQIFDLGHLTFFSLSLFSLCGIYPRGRSFLIKLQKKFFLFYLCSVEALLEADPA
jgi:hypothetical protein